MRVGADLIGKRFGRILVLSKGPMIGKNRAWLCACDCGVVLTIRGDALKSGQMSCGCLAIEHASAANKIHGMCNTAEHSAWSSMIGRCYNPKSRRYALYGGRGISVCDRWLAKFSSFYTDMGPRPSDGHSLDRIDSNGNYEPGNCRWADIETQNRNRSNVRRWVVAGREMTIPEIAEHTGYTKNCIHLRFRNGWTIDEVLAGRRDRKRKAA